MTGKRFWPDGHTLTTQEQRIHCGIDIFNLNIGITFQFQFWVECYICPPWNHFLFYIPFLTWDLLSLFAGVSSFWYGWNLEFIWNGICSCWGVHTDRTHCVNLRSHWIFFRHSWPFSKSKYFAIIILSCGSNLNNLYNINYTVKLAISWRKSWFI